jgi:hypothetical protein
MRPTAGSRAALTEVSRQSAQERRKAYLASAIELRKMAHKAHSAEMQRSFMQLAVLYEELAELRFLRRAER